MIDDWVENFSDSFDFKIRLLGVTPRDLADVDRDIVRLDIAVAFRVIGTRRLNSTAIPIFGYLNPGAIWRTERKRWCCNIIHRGHYVVTQIRYVFVLPADSWVRPKPRPFPAFPAMPNRSVLGSPTHLFPSTVITPAPPTTCHPDHKFPAVNIIGPRKFNFNYCARAVKRDIGTCGGAETIPTLVAPHIFIIILPTRGRSGGRDAFGRSRGTAILEFRARPDKRLTSRRVYP